MQREGRKGGRAEEREEGAEGGSPLRERAGALGRGGPRGGQRGVKPITPWGGAERRQAHHPHGRGRGAGASIKRRDGGPLVETT